MKAKGGGANGALRSESNVHPWIGLLQSTVNVEGRLKRHYCVSNNISDTFMLF